MRVFWVTARVLVTLTALVAGGIPAFAQFPAVSGTLAGTTAGKFEVSEGGTASYTMSLRTPPGTGGHAPMLSLDYSSGGITTFLGTGWSLGGLSIISRCATNVQRDGWLDAVDFDAHDKFCLDGQRLIATSGSYGASGTEYRTEGEIFARILSYGQSGSGPERFTVEFKSGLIFEFGKTSNSRHESLGAAGTLSWLLSEVRDRNGNAYSVTYYKDPIAGEIAPERIDYTYNQAAGLVAYNSIEFEYESRPRAVSRYLDWHPYYITLRLKKVVMYAEGAPAWEYRIGYSEDPFQRESRLVSIEECGAQGECLPATGFEWGSTTAASSEFLPGATVGALGVGHGFSDSQYFPTILGDWNGDGRGDIARVSGSNTIFYAATANGYEHYATVNSQLGGIVYDRNGYKYPAISGDWNGDGRTDFARVSHVLSEPHRFYLSVPGGFQLWSQFHIQSIPSYVPEQRAFVTGDWNGDGTTDIGLFDVDGWEAELIAFLPNGSRVYVDSPFPHWSGTCSITTCPVFVGDWNGDGLSDIARVYADRTIFYVARAGPAQQVSFDFFAYLWDFSPAQGYASNLTKPVIVGDWNGDSLSDFARVDGTGIKFCISSGNGLQPCTHWSGLSPGQGYGDTVNYPLLVGDWNRDGGTDIARAHPSGIQQFVVYDGVPYETTFLAGLSNAQGYASAAVHPMFVTDWNGDGFGDIGRFGHSNVTVFKHAASDSDKIVRIVDGLGAETNIQYALLTDAAVYEKQQSAIYPNVDVQGAISVVSSVSISDLSASTLNFDYRYKGLLGERGGDNQSFFAETKVIDQQTGLVTTVFAAQTGEYQGSPLRIEKRLSNGTLVSKIQNTWNNISFGTHRKFRYVSLSRNEEFDLGGLLVDWEQDSRTYDQSGNLTQSNVTRHDGSTDITVSTFDNDTSHWLLGQLRTLTVTKTNGGAQPIPVVRRTAFSYEGISGRLQDETIEPGTVYELRKSYSYDDFGNIVETRISPAGLAERSDAALFDKRGRFAISITNALGQTETREYDPRFGVSNSITDPNGLVSSTSLDAFGRTILETKSDGTAARTLYLAAGSSAPGGASYYARTDTLGGSPSIKYYDALGRIIRTEGVGDSGRAIYVDHVYDSRGILTHTSLPYFDGDTPIWTISEYDVLGRITDVHAPGDRHTSYSYAGRQVTMIDPRGKSRTQNFDSQGRGVSSTDAYQNSVNYRYDGAGNLREITDPAGNVTAISYDLRGRRSTVSDPNTGVTSFVYDSLGQLVSQTDANGAVRTFQHDLLGRRTQVTSPAGSEFWDYDTAPYGVGKLARLRGLHGYEESYSYDTFGRQTRVERLISGRTFVFHASFDAYSRPDILRYPNGLEVKQHFDSLGKVIQVTANRTKRPLWTLASRNASGQLTKEFLGNGASSERSYDSNTTLLTHIQTSLQRPGDIQNLAFVHDKNGNVTERSDRRRALVESFGYDDLNRLVHAQVAGRAPLSVTYNALGNLTSRSDVGQYTYHATKPHALVAVSGSVNRNFQYDAAGRQIGRTNGTVVYDSQGMVVRVSDGSIVLEFDLDPLGGRLEERSYSGSSLTERKFFVTDLFEVLEQGTSCTERAYIRSPDGLIAVEKSEFALGSTAGVQRTIEYLHGDHLGSVQAITNSSGKVLATLSYDAWGNRRDPSTWDGPPVAPATIERGFGGHRHLDDVALIHMGGRVYDPVVGRFISPDPVVQSPSDLQSLNRYSYVSNNPVSMTDPTGFFSKKLMKSLRKLLRVAVPAAIAIVGFPHLSAYIGTHIVASKVVAAGLAGAGIGIVSAAASGAMSGADPMSSIRAGVRSAPFNMLRASMLNFVGGAELAPIERVAAHGMVGVFTGTMEGQGTLSGFLGGLGSALPVELGQTHVLVSLAAGGTAAALGGGKFSSGVMQSALIYAYNFLGHHGNLQHPSAEGRREQQIREMHNAELTAIERRQSLRALEDTVMVLSGFSENHPTASACLATATGMLELAVGRGAFSPGSGIPRGTNLLRGVLEVVGVATSETPLLDASSRATLGTAEKIGRAKVTNFVGSTRMHLRASATNVASGAVQVGVNGFDCLSGLAGQ